MLVFFFSLVVLKQNILILSSQNIYYVIKDILKPTFFIIWGTFIWRKWR